MNIKKIKEENITAYVKFEELADKKIQYMTELANDEIGALCLVEKYKTQGEDTIAIEYCVTDVFIVEQEVNGATCELSPQGLAKLYGKLGKQANNLLCWYHSHINMGVTPSGQDEIMFKELYNNSDTFYIRIIGNKKGEFNITIYDKEEGYIFSDVLVYVDPIKDPIKDFISAEIKEKVTKKEYKPSVTYTPTKNKKSKHKHSSYYFQDVFDDLSPKNDTLYDLLNDLHITKDMLDSHLRDTKLTSYGVYGYTKNGDYITTRANEYSITEHCVGLYYSGQYGVDDDVELNGYKVNIGDKITDYGLERGWW